VNACILVEADGKITLVGEQSMGGDWTVECWILTPLAESSSESNCLVAGDADQHIETLKGDEDLLLATKIGSEHY